MDFPLVHLGRLTSPTDLHKLSDKELGELATEVRNAILQTVSKTGGHLSSNLGTVELTVAMYAAFTIPPDKVVWDTGHQAYPHKILTGRLDRFQTLRKHGGLSGFLRRDEHDLDVFGAGHAGTAISAALGFAIARDRLGTTERIAAVTGDAAISSGMSWEALNHAGELRTDLTLVLNDNRMSIAPNVGAFTNYLARLRSRPLLQDLAQRAKFVVERMPDPITKVAAGLRHGITHYFAPAPTGTIFEEMGWEYIGPVDGHDLPTLLEIFRNVRELHGPVFVHAITVKGKGYVSAEEDSRKWHGVAPFDLDSATSAAKAGPLTYTQAFGETAIECAAQDPKVVAITAAMPDGTGLTRFSQQFPDRYFDVGIAEQHAVTFSAGLAAGGLKPLCSIYSTFLQRGFDQVLHDVAIQNLPVRFFLDRAGFVGDDGATHHGAFDLSYLLPIPNMVVLSPRDTTELREMTHWMVRYDAHPCAVRYPRGASDDRLPESRSPIQFGRSELLRKAGDARSKVALIACGSMVSVAWQVAERLARLGIEADVLNLRFLKPLDADSIVDSALRCGSLVSIEENMLAGGVGAQIRELLARRGLAAVPMDVLGIPDAFVEHGPQAVLRSETGLDEAGVLDAVQRLLPAATEAGWVH
jgi:1-deoxy-D-xylulose-5-phosphate synthase